MQPWGWTMENKLEKNKPLCSFLLFGGSWSAKALTPKDFKLIINNNLKSEIEIQDVLRKFQNISSFQDQKISKRAGTLMA